MNKTLIYKISNFLVGFSAILKINKYNTKSHQYFFFLDLLMLYHFYLNKIEGPCTYIKRVSYLSSGLNQFRHHLDDVTELHGFEATEITD